MSSADIVHLAAAASGAKRAVLYLRVSTARQASKGGEVEGYSIPAQREACARKAMDLGAVVVDEYVDAGQSARSADRPALQALLDRVAERRDVEYVIVHKVDRLARDRADDVAIGLTIHKAGAVLVSASEQIDDTPAGTLLHGIMAAIAEFYSTNLSHEAKKGMREKAKRGGTPGYAPLGYRNVTRRIDNREVRTVELDPERAQHIRWGYFTYATGSWSITDIVEELDRRGMRSRPTKTFVGTPLTRSQVHRILSNPYYMGTVVYGGVEYAGSHQPLIDSETWHQVQDVLQSRRLAGDRSWKREQYLKGSLFCDRCESRLGFGYSKGKTGERYPYFFCLGRNKKRTDCDFPYRPLDAVVADVERHWLTVRLTPQLIEAVRTSVQEELREREALNEQVLGSQRRRLQRLARSRQKLIDAYLAGALALPDLKQRQEALAAEQREAERLIELTGVNRALAQERLDQALELLRHCGQLYRTCRDSHRQLLNQAFYSELYIDVEGVRRAILQPPFAQLRDRAIGLAEELGQPPEGLLEAHFVSRQRAGGRTYRRSSSQSADMTDDEPYAAQVSNLTLLAEGVGFEPTVGSTHNGFETVRGTHRVAA
ncbi:MAG: recombinase family protein [Actinobacteria bacterium]|nr:recombinase family protein [Actinomycetota bacterium]